MKETYKISQVLYIISPKTQTVIPVQVQEINRKTTLDGEEIQFLVMDPEGRGPHSLNDINGQVFTNPTDVSKFLKDNANKAIDTMVRGSIEIAQDKFGNAGGSDGIFPSKKKVTDQKAKQSTQSPPQSHQKKENEIITEVIDKNGKSKLQKTRIRSIKMPDSEPVQTSQTG